MRQSIKEAHVYIMQELQRQGAFKKDKQYSQSIDLALNTEYSRFIRSRLKSNPTSDRFEVDEPSRCDIQGLIHLNRELTVFQKGNYYISQLPADFGYLLNDSSVVLEDCYKSFTGATENKPERITIIPFENSILTSSTYYKKIIVGDGITSSEFNNGGLETKDDKYYLVDKIISLFKENNIIVYWEKYKDYYYSDTFLIPSFDLSKIYSLTIDNKVIVSKKIDANTIKIKDDLENTSNIISNRNSKNDFISNLLQSNYSTSVPDSPISTIFNNQIQVYGTKRFLITKIFIDYVRLPLPLNLHLNQGFETHATTHDRICDLAVERIKGRIEDETLSTTIQKNNLRGELN